jgi:hypothetical protein
MRGKETVKSQLGFSWAHDIQWRDLPEPIRAQVLDLLRRLLEQVAQSGDRAVEVGDDA